MANQKTKQQLLLTIIFYMVTVLMFLLIGYALFISFYRPFDDYSHNQTAASLPRVEETMIMEERKEAPTKKIAINSANTKELQTLPGIGPVTADAIITFRQEKGPFYFPEDLLFVKGIGPATLENLRPHIAFESELN